MAGPMLDSGYDDRRCRMWAFCLASSEMSFRHGGLMVLQAQLSRSIDAVPPTRHYIADHERMAPRSQANAAEEGATVRSARGGGSIPETAHATVARTQQGRPIATLRLRAAARRRTAAINRPLTMLATEPAGSRRAGVKQG